MRMVVSACRRPLGTIDRGQLRRTQAQEEIMRTILIAAALLCLMEANVMAGTFRFQSDAVGTAPKGWTATKTGRGHPRWTVEQEGTAPSQLQVVKQSGRAAYPLPLKDDTTI